MRSLIAALLTLFISSNAYCLHMEIHRPDLGIDISTDKVSSVVNTVDRQTALEFRSATSFTELLPGPRVILIDSPGGEVYSGEAIIDVIESEKKLGTQIVCVVTGWAASMAFNILTHCDVRLATAKSRLLAHKVRDIFHDGEMYTAKQLRALAKEMDYIDEPFRQANAAAMHLSVGQYDWYADHERIWTAKELLDIKYLHGLLP